MRKLNAVMLVGALALSTPVLAQVKQLGVRGDPVPVVPQRMMHIAANPDGTFTPLSDWIEYTDNRNGSDTGIATHSSLDAFDAYQNDGAACENFATPTGGLSCGLPLDCGENCRWFYGASYCNTFTVSEMDAEFDGTAERVQYAWFWYCSGSGEENCIIGLITGDVHDPSCNVGYNLIEGIAYDFGSLPCNAGGFFITDVDLRGSGLTQTMYADGVLGGILAQAFDGSTFTMATCAQFMLWGSENWGGGNTEGGAGSHDDISYDDDVNRDGEHTPDECYSSLFGVCPDPLHMMVGFGNCASQDGCNSGTNVKGKCRVRTPPELLLKGIVTDATPGGRVDITIRLHRVNSDPVDDEVVAYETFERTANDRGKAKAKMTVNQPDEGPTITYEGEVAACGETSRKPCS